MSDALEALAKRVQELEARLEERYRGPSVKEPPVRPYRVIVKDSKDPGYINRLLVATPTTGLVRIEWVMGRYGQLVPPNWSMVQMNQYLSAFIPLRYSVANAQNVIVREFLSKDFEWLFLIEHDVILPPEAFKLLDDWMHQGKTPVVSGLYYTRSRPSEPLIYRGRGTGYFGEWEFGDLVWCDGVPTGCLLIHQSILRAMWEESDPYFIEHPNGRRDETRKVFYTPRRQWYDPESRQFNTTSGTSDLEWCTRVMKEGFFEKAGWPEYQELEYPFVVDTRMFCRHIDVNGIQYP